MVWESNKLTVFVIVLFKIPYATVIIHWLLNPLAGYIRVRYGLVSFLISSRKDSSHRIVVDYHELKLKQIR